MTGAPVRLVWLLVAIVLGTAAWRILTLHENRGSDQQKLIDKIHSK